ncbi:glycoside hydrolase family 16 protein [Mycobacterium sp. smrl_JER01]|uniref:glycoside hydrolase family 16 protein n=1 Tax=Mycobacterium sp. smrl_JER01 TaxID=3402633 RepID=UPI003AC08B7C
MREPVRIRGAVLGGVLCLAMCACPAPTSAQQSQCPTTAADTLRWGAPIREDDFQNPSSLSEWTVYDGLGHAGNGRRTPGAVSVADGMLTIAADGAGNSGGMGWLPGRMHGRWEVCVKSSTAPAAYHSLALLWPDAEDWPAGGEVDFMEIVDPTRQVVEFWLHWGAGGAKETTSTPVDATQWHSYAVEWTASHLTYFVDGVAKWTITDPSRLPPRPMHLCLQLDYFGGDPGAGAHQWVDWVREYQLEGDTT